MEIETTTEMEIEMTELDPREWTALAALLVIVIYSLPRVWRMIERAVDQLKMMNETLVGIRGDLGAQSVQLQQLQADHQRHDEKLDAVQLDVARLYAARNEEQPSRRSGPVPAAQVARS